MSTTPSHHSTPDSNPLLSKEVDLIEPFRREETLRLYLNRIRKQSRKTPLKIMEVCGGHTHAIMKYGLADALAPTIRFLHGPGCPVCVIPKERIDQAIALASLENTILVTLGDLMRVPGSQSSLARQRALGNDVRFVYSPAMCLEIARENPEKNVIFFAIGFETTTPMSAWLVKKAEQEKIQNLFFHINHVLVPPAMEALLEDPGHEIDAFLAPSHVSVIAGADIYRPFAEKYNIPVVVGGFEPVDILETVEMLLKQKEQGRAEVENQYNRATDASGNRTAKELTDQVFKLRPRFRWRGLGELERSALQLKKEFSHLDAEIRFASHLPEQIVEDDPECLCPEILRGKKLPSECRYFGSRCKPQNPVGACMVSTEGACAAWYRYGGEGV